jgi:hypothetical protein
MNAKWMWIIGIALVMFSITGCGTGQADLDATATSHYGAYYATITAMAPSATTAPSATPMATPTEAPPSATPEPSPTPTLASLPGIDEALEYEGLNLTLVAAQLQEQLELPDKLESGGFSKMEGVYIFEKDDKVEIPSGTNRAITADDTSQTLLVLDAKIEGEDFNPLDEELVADLFESQLNCAEQTYQMMVLGTRFEDGKYVTHLFTYFVPKTLQTEDCVLGLNTGSEISLRSFFE